MSATSIVACPHCRGQIANDPSLAGQQVACPHCKRPLLMPAAPVLPQARAIAEESPSIESESFDFLQSSTPAGRPYRSTITSQHLGRKKKGFPVWLGVVLGIFGVMVLMCGGLALIMATSSGEGTITFAEKVDPQTLETRNEGSHFSRGWVALIVRGTKPFGDRTLTAYSRLHGSQGGWYNLGDFAVDPTWNISAHPFLLEESGMFDIKIVNGKGATVATSTVEISE